MRHSALLLAGLVILAVTASGAASHAAIRYGKRTKGTDRASERKRETRKPGARHRRQTTRSMRRSESESGRRTGSDDSAGALRRFDTLARKVGLETRKINFPFPETFEGVRIVASEKVIRDEFRVLGIVLQTRKKRPFLGNLITRDKHRGAREGHWVLEVYGQESAKKLQPLVRQLIKEYGVEIDIRQRTLQPRYLIHELD